MRVAYVNQDRGIGPGRHKGARVHVECMIEAFRAEGATVTLVEDHEDAAARRALEQHAPFELVYERYALGAEAASAFARSHGIPHVVEVNAPLLDEAACHRAREIEPADREQERRVFSGATRVHAVSSQVADYAVAGGADADRVRVVPNAVDAERFVPARDGGLRAELVPAGRTVLGFHGRLRPWHNLERLAHAVAGLVDEGLALHVLTIGEGDFEATLAAHLSRDVFTCVPWVPHEDMPRHVACYDLLALSYAPDAACYFSPLKLLEGMACGAVPVVPRLGDLPAAVGDAGVVYDPHAKDGLSRAIRELTTDLDRRAALAERAIAAARSRSWRAQAAEVLRLVEEVRA